MSDSPGAVTGTDPVSADQRRAAHAYAHVLLQADVANPAAEDAIAAFRQTLEQRGDIPGGTGSPAANETLLALTRLMTAVSVPDRSLPEDRRQAVWASIGAASHCTCRESAALLATRANGNIQPRESAALDEHLAGCATCRELSVETVAAEQAFRDALTPKRSGLPTLPRAAYAVLALLVAVGVAVFALSTGSGPQTRAVAAAPTQTRAADTIPIATTVTQDHNGSAVTAAKAATDRAAKTRAAAARAAKASAARAKGRRQAELRKLAARRKAAVARQKAAQAAAAAGASPAGDTATTSSDGASSSASEDSSSSADSASSAGSASDSTPASSSAASTATPAPSTAAAVSGQSSLPADSAPQQGIGSLPSQ